MRRQAIRSLADRPLVGLVALLPLAFYAMSFSVSVAAEEELTNPFLGQRQAIEEGKELYRKRCVGCHFRRGGRGPDLHATKLTDEQFLEVVINGRRGQRGVMPMFGTLLSPDDVSKIHAFIRSGEPY